MSQAAAAKLISQRTLKQAVAFAGVGVHSGAEVNITVIPAQENSGIVFRRLDAPEKQQLITANFNNVAKEPLRTVLENSYGVRIDTVEHLLAALYGLGVDNALIEVNGPEIPIMDGSAACFVDEFEKVGFASQTTPRKFIRVLKDISIIKGNAMVRLSPCDALEISCSIDYREKAIGSQKYSARICNGVFSRSIASARTFCLKSEVETMLSNGMARGGSPDNAIIVDDDKIFNDKPLRFSDEFARHKTLDVIGDLSLAGGFVLGRYEGVRMGHEITNLLLKQMFDNNDSWIEETLEEADELQTVERHYA